MAVRGDAEWMLLDIVERGVRLGAFSCADPWLAMAAIGAAGIRVAAWFRPGDRYTVDEVCEQYADIALRIVGFSRSPAPAARRPRPTRSR